MCHIMKKATVRDLRYRFPEIEAQLSKGEEIEVYKRRKVVGRLLPVRPNAEAYPDFSARVAASSGKRKFAQPARILPLTSEGAIDRLRGHGISDLALRPG